jgi:PleD family two-component response regulator
VQTNNVRDTTLVHFDDKPVLVCEDNQLIAAGWAMILTDEGYEVVGPVSSAEKALEAAYSHPPDLALIDIALNGMIDGISRIVTPAIGARGKDGRGPGQSTGNPTCPP